MSNKKNNKAIPLEENLEWWWYKAKSRLLKFLLKKCELNDKNQILEIGPGKGNNLKTLVRFGEIDVLDKEKYFLDFLKNEKSEFIRNFYLDLIEIDKKYDIIVLLDVLEHIKDSGTYLNSLKRILNENGYIILGVPAFEFLWSEHDEKLNHYRRYNWKLIEDESNGFRILERYGFNYLLFPIRYLQIKFSKNITTVNESTKLVNNILFFITTIEHLFRKLGINFKFGTSLYAILKLNNLNHTSQ